MKMKMTEKETFDREKLMEEVKLEIQSLLCVEKGAISSYELKKLYYNQIGSSIPFFKLGYKQLDDLLMNMPDVVSYSVGADGQLYVKVVPREESSHINELVHGQRKAKKHTKPFHPSWAGRFRTFRAASSVRPTVYQNSGKFHAAPRGPSNQTFTGQWKPVSNPSTSYTDILRNIQKNVDFSYYFNRPNSGFVPPPRFKSYESKMATSQPEPYRQSSTYTATTTSTPSTTASQPNHQSSTYQRLSANANEDFKDPPQTSNKKVSSPSLSTPDTSESQWTAPPSRLESTDATTSTGWKDNTPEKQCETVPSPSFNKPSTASRKPEASKPTRKEWKAMLKSLKLPEDRLAMKPQIMQPRSSSSQEKVTSSATEDRLIKIHEQSIEPPVVGKKEIAEDNESTEITAINTGRTVGDLADQLSSSLALLQDATPEIEAIQVIKEEITGAVSKQLITPSAETVQCQKPELIESVEELMAIMKISDAPASPKRNLISQPSVKTPIDEQIDEVASLMSRTQTVANPEEDIPLYPPGVEQSVHLPVVNRFEEQQPLTVDDVQEPKLPSPEAMLVPSHVALPNPLAARRAPRVLQKNTLPVADILDTITPHINAHEAMAARRAPRVPFKNCAGLAARPFSSTYNAPAPTQFASSYPVNPAFGKPVNHCRSTMVSTHEMKWLGSPSPSSITFLERLKGVIEKYHLGKVTLSDSKLKSGRFIASIQVGVEKFMTYPEDFEELTDAYEAAAKQAYTHLKARVSETPSAY